MQIDLKSLSRKDLEKHLLDVKKALKNAEARDRRQARKAAEKAAAEFGFSLDELSDAEKAPTKHRKNNNKKPKAASKPQFANPADPTQTWTGKGRQPNWYRAAIENGATPDSLRI